MHIDIHKENITVNGGNGNDEIWNNCYNYVLINGGKGNDNIENSGDKVSIIGGEDDDKLLGEWDNDCIKGGTGNDSLWGDDGADKFFYSKGDGKDVIFGFDSKDTLTFDNIIFKTSMASYNKSEGTLTLNLSGGSVTLKDFTTSTFHINSDTYKINGSTLKKQ